MMGGMAIISMMSMFDVARFYYSRMQVQTATQMAAQAAWRTCDTTKLPATTNCPGLTAALNASLRSSTLGSNVTLKAGSPSEAYYCVATDGTLTHVSAASTKPANCGAVGSVSDQPGDYLKVQTSYTYAPLFRGISVGSLLPTTISGASLMRLN